MNARASRLWGKKECDVWELGSSADPPPRSKWFLKDLGHEGLNNLLAAYEDKGAKAVCTFGFSQGPGHEPILFQGVTQGRIVPARGPANFGWDPIFEYEGQT